MTTFSKVLGICPNSSLSISAIISETQQSIEGPFSSGDQNLDDSKDDALLVDISFNSNTEKNSEGFIIINFKKFKILRRENVFVKKS